MNKLLAGITTSTLLFLSLQSACMATSSDQTHHRLNAAKLESIIGIPGRSEPGNTLKFSMPRDDLKINVNGVKISSAMGLTSWVTFKSVGKESYMQGDLVLTADQIHPLMSLALNNGIQVTTLQNHFLWENPQVVFMHIECVGKDNHLAEIVGKLFAKIKETSEGKGDLPYADMDPSQTTLDPANLNKILGMKGTLKDGVYKVNILNKEKKTDDQTNNENKLSLNSWAAFVGTNDEAAVDGNIVVDQAVLQKVLLALNKAGIYIVGIHQNISDSDPSFVFIHYWGIGKTSNLAKGIRSALDLQNKIEE